VSGVFNTLQLLWNAPRNNRKNYKKSMLSFLVNNQAMQQTKQVSEEAHG
jgi:hypothetical protein